MKQKKLQHFKSLYGNSEKIEVFVKVLAIRMNKIFGKQKKGKPRANFSDVIFGILYYLKTGCQWRWLPNIFGCWQTIYGWYMKLNKMGFFKILWEEVIKLADFEKILKLKNLLSDGALQLTTSTIDIKAKNPRMKNKNCLNRLIITDKQGLPLGLLYAKGTANDTNFLIPLLDKVKGLITLPNNFFVHADKGFDSSSNRWQVSQRGGRAEIPIRNHGFDIEYVKTKDSKRPIVEHLFAWLNAFKTLKVISTKLITNLYENTYFAFTLIFARYLNVKNIKTLMGSI